MKVINNTVELTNMHLAELPSFLSQVDEIRGNFNVYRNRLKSLNNCSTNEVVGTIMSILLFVFSFNLNKLNLINK